MSRRRDGVCRARYAKRMSADAPNAWLRPVDPHSRLRLLCLPWAGGGANEFRAWPAHLPPGVQVCPLLLPGRESRFREPPIRRMDALVDELVAALEHKVAELEAELGRRRAAADEQLPLMKHSLSLFACVSKIKWDFQHRDNERIAGTVVDSESGRAKQFAVELEGKSPFEVANLLWGFVGGVSVA